MQKCAKNVKTVFAREMYFFLFFAPRQTDTGKLGKNKITKKLNIVKP